LEIAIIADDNKKELMAQFCIAYCGILSRHHLCATHTTAKYIQDATGLEIETYLPGPQGGTDQISARVSYNEIDALFYFRGTDSERPMFESDMNILRLCDVYNIPVATNIATAEVLICALDHGDLDWREIVNPRSDYNKRRRGMSY